jgi:RNA-splicing ligase RtcB
MKRIKGDKMDTIQKIKNLADELSKTIEEKPSSKRTRKLAEIEVQIAMLQIEIEKEEKSKKSKK